MLTVGFTSPRNNREGFSVEEAPKAVLAGPESENDETGASFCVEFLAAPPKIRPVDEVLPPKRLPDVFDVAAGLTDPKVGPEAVFVADVVFEDCLKSNVGLGASEASAFRSDGLVPKLKLFDESSVLVVGLAPNMEPVDLAASPLRAEVPKSEEEAPGEAPKALGLAEAPKPPEVPEVAAPLPKPENALAPPALGALEFPKVPDF